MAGESSEISIVARAAPESEERTIVLRRNPIRISTEDDYDTTCDLFTCDSDSLEALMRLGADFMASSRDKNRQWDVGFLVIASIPPIHRTSPHSKTVSWLEQLRETRLDSKLGHWRSQSSADGPVRDIVAETAEAAEECSIRLARRMHDDGSLVLPDEEYVRQMAVLLREEDAPGRPLEDLPGFAEFCKKVISMAATDPEAAARELANAQKSKNVHRKKMSKLFRTMIQDEIFRLYCQGMALVRPELQKQEFCEDAYSQGFYRFFHEQQAYLDGWVPELHRIAPLLLRSRRFIDAAASRFGCDACEDVPLLVQADFFGAIEAAAHVYRDHILGERTVNLEKKKRKTTIYLTGSDLERLAYDKGIDIKGGIRRHQKVKKTKKAKKAKKAKRAKKKRGK